MMKTLFMDKWINRLVQIILCFVLMYFLVLSFRNVLLENALGEGKSKTPKPVKTGTTIAGVVFKVNRGNLSK